MTTHTKQSIAALALSFSLIASFALPVSAETASTSTAPSTSVQKAIAKADKEISSRIEALNKLAARIQEIKNLTDADKSTLAGEIQTQITTLNTLKSKIDADTDAAALKTDMASITVDYRIYALVIPQAQIVAAADRLKTIALDISIVGNKLQTRIASAQTAGSNVTALQTSLTDMQAKITDAQTQAQTAVTAVATLVPDQGDSTKSAANASALKDARAALKAGQADIVAARKDANAIVKGLRAFKPKGTASSTEPKETN